MKTDFPTGPTCICSGLSRARTVGLVVLLAAGALTMLVPANAAMQSQDAMSVATLASPDAVVSATSADSLTVLMAGNTVGVRFGAPVRPSAYVIRVPWTFDHSSWIP